MSLNAIEKVLWQVHTNPAEVVRFRDDPAAYISEFNLEPREREWLTSFNAGAMAQAGISTMALMMTFQAVWGPQRMGEYMQSLAAAREAN